VIGQLKILIKILTHLSIISLVAGMVMMSRYLSASNVTLIVPVIALLLSELHSGMSKTSSSNHFSAAVALFFIIFYLTLFGTARPDRESFLFFALLTSAIWLIGRFGFLLGRLISKKRRA